MRKFLILCIGFSILIPFVAHASALIDPALKSFAYGLEPDNVERVVFLVKPPARTFQRPPRYDRAGVIAYYKQVSSEAIRPVMESIDQGLLPGVQVLQAFWINASVLALVTPQGLISLAQNEYVTKIYADKGIESDPGHPEVTSERRTLTEGVPLNYDMTSLGMDRLNKEFPQITGQNILVGVEDSGVEGTHPALKGKVALFYNGHTKTTGNPQDFDGDYSHGTHVCGTIAGGDRDSMWIGIAPGAKLVVAATVDTDLSYDGELAGMQWFLDEEKNPAVAAKIKVVNNSWTTDGAPDQEVFYRAMAAWEAAGILPVFSAGNSGEAGARSITHPHEYPGTFAVGATGVDGRVAAFSSRGPAIYNGKEVQKPDLTAPGVGIYSSIAGGAFGKMDGTSMASPHVTGAIALLLQINPNLNPQQIRLLLEESATPGDGQSPGQWNPDYGFGKLNVYNAVKLAMQRTLELNEIMLGEVEILPNAVDKMGIRQFAQATLGEVGGSVDQWQGTDSSRWMTLQDLTDRR